MTAVFLKDSFLNKILGLNIIAWGIIGFLDAPTISLVRVCITILNIVVGLLIFFRQYAPNGFKLNYRSFWLPALISNALVFKFSTPLFDWNISAQLLFLLGSIITLIAFLFLGKEFSIRPAFRNLIKIGPYHLIRHPAYLGESIMGIACVWAKPNIYSGCLLVVFIVAQMLRIKEEELVLSANPQYKIYTTNTKWRLFPFVW